MNYFRQAIKQKLNAKKNISADIGSGEKRKTKNEIKSDDDEHNELGAPLRNPSEVHRKQVQKKAMDDLLRKRKEKKEGKIKIY